MNRRGNGQYVRELFHQAPAARFPVWCSAPASSPACPAKGEAGIRRALRLPEGNAGWSGWAPSPSPRRRERRGGRDGPSWTRPRSPRSGRSSWRSSSPAIMDEYNAGLHRQDAWRCWWTGTTRRPDSYYGRTYADSPDIDGRVWIAAERTADGRNLCSRLPSTAPCDGDLTGIRGGGGSINDDGKQNYADPGGR